MGRAPCCSKVGLHRGPWSAKEDALLINYIRVHGEGHWRSLPKRAGLHRCGNSCRLRWMNYLGPDIKRGNISSDEEDLIIKLHSLLGNRWALIAKRLPGRTDYEIRNYWNSHLSKRVEKSRVTEQMLKNWSQSTSGKKHQRNNQSTANAESTKTRIYFPRAVRVSQYSIPIMSVGFDSTARGSSSYGHGEGNINTVAPRLPDIIEEEADNYSNASDISNLDFESIENRKYQQVLNFEDNVQLYSFSSCD